MRLDIDLANTMAHDNDESQAFFLNMLSVHLYIACGGDMRKWEDQLSAVARRLDMHGIKLINDLAVFVATPRGPANG